MTNKAFVSFIVAGLRHYLLSVVVFGLLVFSDQVSAFSNIHSLPTLSSALSTTIMGTKKEHMWVPFSSSALSVASSSSSSSAAQSSSSSSSWFGTTTTDDTITPSLDKQKAVLLQLGAALDRGQAYNPTSGEYYADRMQIATEKIQALLQAHPNNVPTSMADIQGEWELVLSTVAHGIFRSSPFFLAIQESYEYVNNEEDKQAFGMNKAQLFFKLHELQTCSWGVSKIGRVAQHICDGYLYSEFDTSIFSLTVIPILGWFKLLPTFGGCVVTAAKTELQNDGLLKMTVDYTTARKVPGLTGLGEWIWSIKVPVGAIWKLLPWNEGRDANCQVWIRFCDDDFRIVQDNSGDYFVYTRPVVPRPLDLAAEETKK